MNLQDAADRFTSAYSNYLVRTALAAIAILVLLKLLMPAGGASAAIALPEPDCGQDGAAAMVCADGVLRALKDGANVAIIDAAAQYQNQSAARKELKAIAPQLVAMRDYAAADGGVGLHVLMRGQLEFLQALDKPRDGYEGRWLSPMGEIVISAAPSGVYADLQAVEPASKAWSCAARSTAKLLNGALLFAEGDHSISESKLEGWTIQMKREGALLRVTEIPPSGGNAEAARPYCNSGGGMAGAYFPAR